MMSSWLSILLNFYVQRNLSPSALGFSTLLTSDYSLWILMYVQNCYFFIYCCEDGTNIMQQLVGFILSIAINIHTYSGGCGFLVLSGSIREFDIDIPLFR